jgi:phenylacetate-coenzyme A ligase PaaK-like adenylate-forming protein
LSLEIFKFQAENNSIYKEWLKHLKVDANSVRTIQDIPFLPISFFKNQCIVSGQLNPKATIFTSSSTTSQISAKHYVNDIGLYEKSFMRSFEQLYGSVNNYCILALLPNYLQRQGSSLVYMVDYLIKKGNNIDSGFYLDNLNELKQKINRLKTQNQKVLLIGVSYALLDLCELDVELNGDFIVMETGGMKGRRKEMIKEELHKVLKKGLGVDKIHSEYGMTELLSQAYSKENGIFENPPWMRFLIRDIDDPLQIQKQDKTGGINVIDLANIYSCSFIATQDLGKLNENNQLELMGRFDHSDVRGCNLMMGSF